MLNRDMIETAQVCGMLLKASKPTAVASRVLLRRYQISFMFNRNEQQLVWIGVSSLQHLLAAPGCSITFDCMHRYC